MKIHPHLLPPLDEAELQAIRQRVLDGIFLGGTHNDAYEQYVIAHRDRAQLLRRLDEMLAGQ